MSPLGIYFPTVQLGIERNFNDRFSLAAEAGPQLYRLNPLDRDTSFVKNTGFKASAGVRYYFKSHPIFQTGGKKWKQKHRKTPGNITTPFGTYAGINLFTRSSRYNISVGYNNQSGGPFTDYFWVRKQAWGSLLQLGFQAKLGRKLVLDFFTGISAYNRTARNYERQYRPDTDIRIQSVDLNIRTLYETSSLAEENGWQGGFETGARIGLRF